MPVSSLVIGGASGLLSGITGAAQRAEGRRLLANNPYPTEVMPNEVLQNQELARLRANTGLPSEQYQQAQQNINRQQNAAIASAADRRGGLEMTANATQGGTDALLKLDAANAQQRLQNESQLMNVNNQVASWRSKLFDWNQRNRYLQQREYALGLLGAGNTNIYAGADKVLGGVGQAWMGGLFNGSGGGANGDMRGSSNLPSSITPNLGYNTSNIPLPNYGSIIL